MQLTGNFPYMVKLYRGCFLENMKPVCLCANQAMSISIVGGKQIFLAKNIHIYGF